MSLAEQYEAIRTAQWMGHAKTRFLLRGMLTSLLSLSQMVMGVLSAFVVERAPASLPHAQLLSCQEHCPSSSINERKTLCASSLVRVSAKSGGMEVDPWLNAFPLSGDPAYRALSPKDRERVDANPYLAYGSTLVLVGVTPSHLVCAQIGDGARDRSG